MRGINRARLTPFQRGMLVTDGTVYAVHRSVYDGARWRSYGYSVLNIPRPSDGDVLAAAAHDTAGRQSPSIGLRRLVPVNWLGVNRWAR